MKLVITNEEKMIFDMILSCKPKNVTARVAGGWVRDKIMGISSNDMDIALENISGYNFALLLQSNFSKSISKVSIIQTNPEKSKHLETAVCKIKDKMVDFVNLRTEIYSDSRIPIIIPSNPYEDAFRRDLSINSLFYNIETKEVEDFTKIGLYDIRNHILRTPLDPYLTFKDDPLRILRVFRFRAKLNFNIHDSIIKALENEDLKDMLSKKVSKERISIELIKILKYKLGYEGIFSILQNKYVFPIFGLNANYEEIKKFYKKIVDNYLKNDINYIDDLKWVYNLYIILISTSGTLIEDEKKKLFFNCRLVKEKLLFPNKMTNLVKSIETGIYKMHYLDLLILTEYNANFIIYTLGEHWHIILDLIFIKLSNKNIESFLKFVTKNNISYQNIKPDLDVSNISEILNIEKNYIKFFYKESIIFKRSYPDKDVLMYLQNNKKEIIKKHQIMEI